jgi:hypothetical protein
MSERGSACGVEEFLELEAEPSSGTKRTETYEQGNIAGVAKIPAADVPDGYPVSIGTQQALRLDVETPEGETVATYIEWPDGDEDSEAQRASNASGEQGDPRASDHVERLLDALGRSHDEFANVYGDRVALDAVDGWHGIDPDRTATLQRTNRTSSDDAPTLTRKLLAAAVGVGAVGYVLSNSLSNLAALLVLASWVAIAALLYTDGKRVTESTDWSPSYARWAAAALVPILNVSVGTAYLIERHVQFSKTGASDMANAWHKVLIAAVVLSVVGFGLVGGAESVGSGLFFYSFGVLPFATYFDATYTEEATTSSPSRTAWTIIAAAFGPLGASAYLLVRKGELA